MSVPPTGRIDSVTFEVLRNAFQNIAEEMAITIRRSAYSTNIRTRGDFSCVLFDARLRCLALSFGQPGHLVSMLKLVPAVVRERGGALRPGEAVLCNDPYRGASHLNDITCISPLYLEGECIGYAANMAHHVDVGGTFPTSLGVGKEIYHEGVIIPPTTIAVDGRLDENVLRLILENFRAPRESEGDLKAQLAANHVGNRRVAEIFARYGASLIDEFATALVAYTDEWTASEIALLPQGTFSAEGFRDDDGVGDEPIRLNASVTIGEGTITLDVTGSSAQRKSPINCTRHATLCILAIVAKHLLSERIPINEGFLNRLRVVGPEGLCCTATKPTPVVGGWELGQRLVEVIWLALHPALPERVPAAGKGLIFHIGLGGFDPIKDEYFCYMETIAGGNGARPNSDGPDAVQTHVHNTENAPVEEVELNYPFMIDRYELIDGSGGDGQFRGGLGIRRDYYFPHTPVAFTILSDGKKFAPWGLRGGLPGKPARYVYDPGGERRELPSKTTFDVPVGGRVRVETPGGGGFGDPALRVPAARAADFLNGKVTEPGAGGKPRA